MLLYGIILNQYTNYLFVFLILVLIFALYVLWDILCIIDYFEDYKKEKKFYKKYSRQLITLSCFIIILLLYKFNFIINQIVGITSGLFIVIIYRMLKIKVKDNDMNIFIIKKIHKT